MVHICSISSARSLTNAILELPPSTTGIGVSVGTGVSVEVGVGSMVSVGSGAGVSLGTGEGVSEGSRRTAAIGSVGSISCAPPNRDPPPTISVAAMPRAANTSMGAPMRSARGIPPARTVGRSAPPCMADLKLATSGKRSSLGNARACVMAASACTGISGLISRGGVSSS